jgi:hypothetical protein
MRNKYINRVSPLTAQLRISIAENSRLSYEMLCEKVYLKELVSVLPAGDALHGAPGPSSPLTVQQRLPTRLHYLIRCSVRRSI